MWWYARADAAVSLQRRRDGREQLQRCDDQRGLATAVVAVWTPGTEFEHMSQTSSHAAFLNANRTL